MSSSGTAAGSPRARREAKGKAVVESSSSSLQEAKGEAGDSSGAREEAPRKSWTALVSKPVILSAETQRARAMANDARTTAELDLNDAPRPSNLVLHPRIVTLGPSEAAYQPSAYILAAERSGGLLFRVTKPGRDDPADKEEIMYLCSSRGHKALTLPAVPSYYLGVEAQPHRSVGLIAYSTLPGGHYMVAQLCPGPPDDRLLCFKPLHLPDLLALACMRPPSSTFRGDNLLCFSTMTPEWYVKPLHTTTAVRKRNLRGETGVLAHAGCLYWLALAYGIFVCDPFAEPSHLRFVPLPDGCRVWEEEEELSEINRANIALRRRVAPSEGRLRYVEIHGPSYDVAPDEPLCQPMNPSVRMWTLVDPAAAEPWRFEDELQARFDVLWAHPSYVHFGLPYMAVPHVALVDPDNHHVVYFLQGSRIYGLDLQARQVISCEDDCPPVHDDREIMLRNSRPIIDAWEWSPPGELNNGERNRWVIEHVDAWLQRMEVASGGPSSRSSG